MPESAGISAAIEEGVVVSTALIPGRAAPVLVTEDMVRSMKPGSVIVDLAAGKGPDGQGGNCPLSVADRTVVVHGVTIVGETNLAAMVGADAFQRDPLRVVRKV